MLQLLFIAMQKLYVTMFPCNECAKLLIQAGIQEVVFYEASDLKAGSIVTYICSASWLSQTLLHGSYGLI